MKTKLFLLISNLFLANTLFAQYFNQYFDGADTSVTNSILIQMETDSTNIWQVGAPNKAIFNLAATAPNAMITDTANYYPPNNRSSFQFAVAPWVEWGVLAIQWKQKLDIDSGFDGGMIEFSIDSGQSWQNAFENPNVYNFYGFDPANKQTLPDGDFVFSGTDSAWRDIWLCYDFSWLRLKDSIHVRFTFLSDSVDNNKEGWMIDNLMLHQTIFHTSVNEFKQDKYLSVYPNPASNIIYIEAQKLPGFHIVEQMALINSLGQVVEQWENIPTKYFINAQKYSNGLYYLKVRTNKRSELIPIIIRHN